MNSDLRSHTGEPLHTPGQTAAWERTDAKVKCTYPDACAPREEIISKAAKVKKEDEVNMEKSDAKPELNENLVEKAKKIITSKMQ